MTTKPPTPTQRTILAAMAKGATIRCSSGGYHCLWSGWRAETVVAELTIRGLERRGWIAEREFRLAGGPVQWRYEITEAGREALGESQP